jgi:hypothetical protein
VAALAATTAHVAGQNPLVPGANVNMVRGTAFVDGDPYLQRQNEPSIAISTRNPCHLLAGANDYRTVDYPDPTPLPNEGTAPIAPNIQTPRDAWLGVFTSMDCGATWKSKLLPGHPFDTSPEGQAPGNPNRGYTSGADPVVRAGTNGLFFYAGLVFDRLDQSRSQIFVARFIDNNHKERGDTIEFVDANAVDNGDPDTFVDKPWVAVDRARAGAAMCNINGQQFPAGRVYAAWARFEGGGARIMLARSSDCGQTWQTQALSDTALVNQGASIAVAPHDGTVYVAPGVSSVATARPRPSRSPVHGTEAPRSSTAPWRRRSTHSISPSSRTGGSGPTRSPRSPPIISVTCTWRGPSAGLPSRRVAPTRSPEMRGSCWPSGRGRGPASPSHRAIRSMTRRSTPTAFPGVDTR